MNTQKGNVIQEMNWLAFTVITRDYYKLIPKLLVEWSYYSTPYNNVAYQLQVIVHNFLDSVQIVI